MNPLSEKGKQRIQELQKLSSKIGFDPEDLMLKIMSILGNFEEMMIQFLVQIEALLEALARFFW
ncbi:MAG: hypothetical protein KME40_33815 [Komarekiella atlantica HA4396-MV6]|jgi:hypothetical protein|nr:hypothetical protein [Komarekiella atlantica HA4396-MV6]